MKKNLLITGASGFIGEYLSEKFSENYNVIGLDIRRSRKKFFYKFYSSDLSSKKKIEKIFKINKISLVIHAAAEKNLMSCETNRDRAYKSNVLSTKKLFESCKTNGAKFIFISSDQVFDGKKGNYSEISSKHPINHYGVLKDLCEDFLLKDESSVICRTALVFGNIPLGQKRYFNKIKKANKLIVQGYILDHVKYKLKNKERIILPKNEFCNPTNNFTLYNQLNRIILKNLSGIFHCCGGEKISRYEFGKKIAKQFNLDSSLIDPSPSEDILRPKDVSLKFEKSSKKMQFIYPKLNEMIKQVKEEPYANFKG